MDDLDEAKHRKQAIRAEARERRRRQANADAASETILDRLSGSDEYARSRTVMTYLDFRSEVRTRPLLPRLWRDGRRVVVPYREGDHLELFLLDGLDQLQPCTLGILEPKADLRARPESRATIDEVDLIVVPGLAFDPGCARIGYGKGYYDRLLHRARPDAAVMAVAFQCQIFPELPALPYNVRVDTIVTEHQVYRRTRPRWDHGS